MYRRDPEVFLWKEVLLTSKSESPFYTNLEWWRILWTQKLGVWVAKLQKRFSGVAAKKMYSGICLTSIENIHLLVLHRGLAISLSQHREPKRLKLFTASQVNDFSRKRNRNYAQHGHTIFVYFTGKSYISSEEDDNDERKSQFSERFNTSRVHLQENLYFCIDSISQPLADNALVGSRLMTGAKKYLRMNIVMAPFPCDDLKSKDNFWLNRRNRTNR